LTIHPFITVLVPQLSLVNHLP